MRSEAQKKADKTYRTKKLTDGTKKQINATLNIDDYNMIDQHCAAVGMSKAAFIVAAARYCIDHDIDLMENTNNEQ